MTWLIPHWAEYLCIGFIVAGVLVALGGWGK